MKKVVHIFRYFLLVVEFPFLYRATRAGEQAIAVRFSEMESIESVQPFVGLVDWVWIDTITKVPVAPANLRTLGSFRTCLVCPSLWGRPGEIDASKRQAVDHGLDAVMTEARHAMEWADPDALT